MLLKELTITTVYPVENFKTFGLRPDFICQPAIRPTTPRHMGSVFSHKKGDRCLNLILLYRRAFVLSAMAYPLVFHSIDLSPCFNYRCQNLTYHKHSMKGVNVNNLGSRMH